MIICIKKPALPQVRTPNCTLRNGGVCPCFAYAMGILPPMPIANSHIWV